MNLRKKFLMIFLPVLCILSFMSHASRLSSEFGDAFDVANNAMKDRKAHKNQNDQEFFDELAHQSDRAGKSFDELVHQSDEAVESFDALVRKKIDRKNVNDGDIDGNTVLLFASALGLHELVAHLLSLGADVDACNIHGETPLMIACQCGNVRTFNTIIAKNPNPYLENTSGYNAQYYAQRKSNKQPWDVISARLSDYTKHEYNKKRKHSREYSPIPYVSTVEALMNRQSTLYRGEPCFWNNGNQLR